MYFIPASMNGNRSCFSDCIFNRGPFVKRIRTKSASVLNGGHTSERRQRREGRRFKSKQSIVPISMGSLCPVII